MAKSSQSPRNETESRRFLIVMAHGSPASETTVEFTELVQKWAILVPDSHILMAFLSVGKPDLSDALADAVLQGATEIVVQPLLVFTGKHILVDLPALVQSFQSRHPSIAVRVGAPLGSWPGFEHFLADGFFKGSQ
jgi:sirohydrochlorin ferrochelatase